MEEKKSITAYDFIKPTSLGDIVSMHRDDPEYVGKIVLALYGHGVETLTKSEHDVVNIIRRDGERFKENIEAKRKKNRELIKKWRERQNNASHDVMPCNEVKCDVMPCNEVKGTQPSITSIHPIHTIHNITPPTPSKGDAAADAAVCARDFFAEFWEAYPKKQNRNAAEREWKRAVGAKDADAELPERIVEAAQRWAASDECRNRETRYIVNPDKWLKNRRWEDELNAPPPKPKPKPRIWTPKDWALCAERCANCGANGGCRFAKVPPDKEAAPRPPEECPHYSPKEDGQ